MGHFFLIKPWPIFIDEDEMNGKWSNLVHIFYLTASNNYFKANLIEILIDILGKT